MWNKGKASFHGHGGPHGRGNHNHNQNQNHNNHGSNSHSHHNARTPTSVEEGEISSPHTSQSVSISSSTVSMSSEPPKPKPKTHHTHSHSGGVGPGIGMNHHHHHSGMRSSSSSFRSSSNHDKYEEGEISSGPPPINNHNHGHSIHPQNHNHNNLSHGHSHSHTHYGHGGMGASSSTLTGHISDRDRERAGGHGYGPKHGHGHGHGNHHGSSTSGGNNNTAPNSHKALHRASSYPNTGRRSWNNSGGPGSGGAFKSNSNITAGNKNNRNRDNNGASYNNTISSIGMNINNNINASGNTVSGNGSSNNSGMMTSINHTPKKKKIGGYGPNSDSGANGGSGSRGGGSNLPTSASIPNWEPPRKKTSNSGGGGIGPSSGNGGGFRNSNFNRRGNTGVGGGNGRPGGNTSWRDGGGGVGRHNHGSSSSGNQRFDYNKRNLTWRRGSNGTSAGNSIPGANDTSNTSIPNNYYGPKGSSSGINNGSDEKSNSTCNYYGNGPTSSVKQESGNHHSYTPSKSRMDGSLSSSRTFSSKGPYQQQQPPYMSPGPKKPFQDDRWKKHSTGSYSATSGGMNRGIESPRRPIIPSKSFEQEDRNAPELGQVVEVAEPGQIHDETSHYGSERGASSSSPTKMTLKFQHSTLASKRNAPKTSKSGHEMTTTAAPKKEMTTPTPPVASPIRLTCATLGNIEKSQKAMKVVCKLSDLVADDGLKVKSDSFEKVHLPTTDQIHKGKVELDIRIDERKKEVDSVKMKIKELFQSHRMKREVEVQEEEKRRVRELERREKHQHKGKIEELTVVSGAVDEERSVVREEAMKKGRQIVEAISKMEQDITNKKQAIHTKEVVEFKGRISTRYEKLILDCQESLTKGKNSLNDASKIVSNIDKKIEMTKTDLTKDPPETLSTEFITGHDGNPAFPTEMEIDSAIAENIIPAVPNAFSDILHLLKDSHQKMGRLVNKVRHENKILASQAHNDSKLMLNNSTIEIDSDGSPPMLAPEQPHCDDIASFEKYIAHWNFRAHQVTGPGDALYNHPMEAPLYESIQKNHNHKRHMIKEHVRGKKRKLYHRWIELSQEYAVREQLYKKDSRKHLNGMYSMDTIGESFSILGQRRGGGGSSNSFSPETNNNSRATNNPYRSSRTRRSAGLGFQSGLGGCDIVRSDYEQEQIIAQLTAQENMEKRIKLGGSELPRQVCSVEKQLNGTYKDTMTNRRVYDPLEYEREHQMTNPWSDMEKCIFFDRFLQYPKDFRKIASFLKNKTTHDCIAFYYDSKQIVPYKAALKEHLTRKKRRGDGVSWEATIQAAISLGATITTGVNSEKPLLFTLPENDQTFFTRYFHPLKLDLFDPNVSEVSVEKPSDSPNKSSKRKASVGTLFTLDPSQRKYLRNEFGVHRINSSSDMDNSISSSKISRSSSASNIQDRKMVAGKGDASLNVGRRGTSKWTDDEKTIFFETLEKYGKKWEVLAETIGTKTVGQIRNFYYDYKKNNTDKVSRTGKEQKTEEKERRPTPNETRLSSTSTPPALAELTEIQNPMHLAQMGQNITGLPMPVQESARGPNDPIMSEGNMVVNQGWHTNQHQFALALEQHRQRQQQQQQHLSEQQRLYDHHLHLEQLAQHHLMGQRQLQQQQQQHLIDLMSHRNGVGVPHWIAQMAPQQPQHPESLRDLVDGGSMSSSAHLQTILRLAHQRQQHMQLQPGTMQGMNPSNGDNNDLNLLARMASDASRSNQQNRNL